MKPHTQDSVDALSGIEKIESEKPGTVNGQIISITRNFGKLPLKDILGKVVVRQLSQNAKSDEAHC